MEGEDAKGMLKGKVQEFLNEFEASGESEEEMKMLLSMWRDQIESDAHSVGSPMPEKIKTLMNVCEDYAGNRGMIERVKKEAEEIRIILDI